MLRLKENCLHKAIQDRFLLHLSNLILAESLEEEWISHCFPCRHSPSSRKPPGLTLRLGFHTPAPAAAMALPAEIPNYGSVGLQCWHLPTQPQTCSFLLRASCRHPIGTAVNHPCPRTDLCSWPASEIFPPTNPWEPPRAPFNNLRCHYVKQKWY